MKQKKPQKTWLPILIIVIALIAVMSALVAAKYIKNAGDVVNKFSPAESVTPIIHEQFDNNVKENVYFEVGDTDYPVYVRAAIVITWQNEEGTVYFSKPETADYTLVLNKTYWEKKSDGFYYYSEPVESGGKTPILIYECKQINPAPAEGYTLSVEIIAQTVQAVGSTDENNPNGVIPAYEDAWGLS